MAGIERLLQRAGQPVDLVDEEHRPRLQGGQDTRRRRPCAPAPGRRSGGRARPSSAATIWASEVLPSPGGPASSTWSSASPRLAAASMETASWSRTASWPTKSASRRGRSERSTSSSSLGQLARDPGTAPDAHRRALRSAWAIRSSVLSPAAPSSSSSTSDRAVAEAEQRLPGQRRRVVPAGDGDRLLRQRRAHLLPQLDDDPLGGALADPGRPAGGPRRRRRRRRAARAGERPTAPPARTLGPTDWTPSSIRNRSRSSSVANP